MVWRSKTKTRWYRGVSELFSSVDVKVNFCNGIDVNPQLQETGSLHKSTWPIGSTNTHDPSALKLFHFLLKKKAVSFYPMVGMLKEC